MTSPVCSYRALASRARSRRAASSDSSCAVVGAVAGSNGFSLTPAAIMNRSVSWSR
ncbi:Uncharacterised protein [Mycobacteroides abscessus subsp. abscessus]|nr:Uncharacterised protein [Mycobacteroides abscessus subsp. abscessus]SKU12133.1 Uncharacterised protein [Mycobacteroides abscessus subsp. abscessus]